MAHYRAALALCILGNMFLTAALAMALYMLFIYTPSVYGGGLAAAFAAALGYAVGFAMALLAWLLGMIFLLSSFLLSRGERSGALGLSFGYAALLHVIFLISILTTIVLDRFRFNISDPESLQLTIAALVITAVVALLLGIAATRRF